jgi:hypothetical protein
MEVGMATTRVSDLVAIAARLSGLTPNDITGKRRFRHLVRVRQAVAHVAVQQRVHSTPQIGKMLGGRDHSTIIYANTKAVSVANRDAEYAAFIARLRREANAADQFLEGWGEQFEFALPVRPPPKPPKPQRRPMFASKPDDDDTGHKFHKGIAAGSDSLLAALRAAA